MTITADMEDLGNALFLDDVPESWTRRAYPSMSGLAAWFVDLLLRIKELESWTSDFCLPNVVWLSGFFNPQSFLTAIEQSMARKNEWPLDKMALQVESPRNLSLFDVHTLSVSKMLVRSTLNSPSNCLMQRV